MIQDGFYEGFEMVGISLKADKRSIQSRIDLLEEGMCQIVGQSSRPLPERYYCLS